ncbi:hypothetical protein NDU88_004008 [Pleurodeles waltl]|uniref:Uncharacterized protein n=1 Tax=Pleurodeles waltl TaxID=8319 RepID=A0AAV7VH03_PLEWA|nr:hypothetical protein NDU88_004008 [Pleurodeles waltl]
MAPNSLRGGPRSRRVTASPSGSPTLVRNPTSGGDGTSGLLERARLLRPGSQPPDRPRNHVKQLGVPPHLRNEFTPGLLLWSHRAPRGGGGASLRLFSAVEGAPARGPRR